MSPQRSARPQQPRLPRSPPQPVLRAGTRPASPAFSAGSGPEPVSSTLRLLRDWAGRGEATGLSTQLGVGRKGLEPIRTPGGQRPQSQEAGRAALRTTLACPRCQGTVDLRSGHRVQGPHAQEAARAAPSARCVQCAPLGTHGGSRVFKLACKSPSSFQGLGILFYLDESHVLLWHPKAFMTVKTRNENYRPGPRAPVSCQTHRLCPRGRAEFFCPCSPDCWGSS